MQNEQKILDDIHGLIHEAAFALSKGDTKEVERIHRQIDLITHDALA